MLLLHSTLLTQFWTNFSTKGLKYMTTIYDPLWKIYHRRKAIFKLVVLTSTHSRADLIFINFTSQQVIYMRDNQQDYAEGCWHCNTHSKTILKILVIFFNYIFYLIVRSQSCWSSNIHLALHPLLLFSNVLENPMSLKLHANHLKGINICTQVELENRKIHEESCLRTKLSPAKIKHWFTVTLWKHWTVH